MRCQEVLRVRSALLFLIGATTLLTALLTAFPLGAQEKPRVFIGVNGTRRSEGYKDPVYRDSTATVEDRTVELSRDFADSCKEVTVNANRKKADYVARFNWMPGRTRVAVYRADGDLVGGTEKLTVAGAVKGACEIMKKDQPQSTAGTETKPAGVDSTK
jgi:hypothetical protein